MSMDTPICNCNGVNLGGIINCVKSERLNAQAVMETTRAGTACGSCESMVREIVDWASGNAAPPSSPVRGGTEGEHALQQKYNTGLQALAFYKHQMLDHLNSAMRAFITCQEMGNVNENPRVGLMFVDFTGDRVGLHVNGKARIVENDEFGRLLSGESGGGAVFAEPGNAENNSPSVERWVVVPVCDAFIHCSKHVPQMEKVEREVQWGTDDPCAKGGDYFGAASGQK